MRLTESHFNMAATIYAHRMCSSVRRLPAIPANACDVTGLLYYSLQFLISIVTAYCVCIVSLRFM